MPIDYAAISRKSPSDYKAIIRQMVGFLSSELYADQAHFIYEILQNAEDALANRGIWRGNRAVSFDLHSDSLEVSHYGRPFDEDDVRAVCSIFESTKRDEPTAIGHFGVGFKSVYAYTNAPEIHSGDENFVIDGIDPHPAPPPDAPHPDKTVIRIPFKPDVPNAKTEIAEGLRRLNARSLLFLRQIESIRWSDDDGHSGGYSRSEPEAVGEIARKVTLTQQGDDGGASKDWLVFSRDVLHESKKAGSVEIAFKLSPADDGKAQSIEPTRSSLVVFFPTIISTDMGFVMQGPYRTIASRNDVPINDAWNQRLMRETADLLIDALKELRELGMLNVTALQCLPLGAPRSSDDAARFAPIRDRLKSALLTERLIPAHPRGYVAGQNAKIARGGPLRSLLSRDRLTALTASSAKQVWLSEEITENRTPTLHSYLTDTLGVEEITPEWLISKLTKEFLENQPDRWITKLYGFLNRQSGLHYRLRRSIPMVRLQCGAHVPTLNNAGGPQVYLPGESKTGFPTVRQSVCKSKDALAFLKALGLREPDLVDDVIDHIIPKYKRGSVDATEHEEYMGRMIKAHATGSNSQRYRSMMSELSKTPFVPAVDHTSGATQSVCPEQAYMPTEALRSLFDGVPGVLFADRSQDYMRGEAVRNLLRAAGMPVQLARESAEPTLTYSDKSDLRWKETNTRSVTREISVLDYTLTGLDALFVALPNLPADEAASRAKLLWDALCAFQQNGNSRSFSGVYSWFYRTVRQAYFPARFVNLLNQTAWVPDKEGVLRKPSEMVFEDTNWQENPTLASHIKFMTNPINRLSEEAGVDADAVRLIKEHNLTAGELKEFIAAEAAEQPDAAPPDDAATAAKIAEGGAPYPYPSRPGAPQGDRPVPRSAASGGNGNGNRVPTSDGRPRPTNPRQRFVSYVAVSPDENDAEPDGLGNEERLNLESQALALVISKEPSLQRTQTNNPGYDLFEADADGDITKYVEVKSMTAALEDSVATLSATQFEFAQEKGNAFWLYIVERADSPDRAKIIPIQDPAGKARAFTFDKGWLQAAHR